MGKERAKMPTHPCQTSKTLIFRMLFCHGRTMGSSPGGTCGAQKASIHGYHMLKKYTARFSAQKMFNSANP
jgi:hypothetical protein